MNMGMNNQMNIGMNNQNEQMMANFMDYNNLKIKNIIKPYEEKIKKLEKEIMDKDFEIASLKDKLYNMFNINQNPPFFNPIMQQMMQMNINNMNLMPNNNNEDKKKNVWYRTIKFRWKSKNATVSVQVKSDDKIQTAIQKFCSKANCDKSLFSFIYNSKIISDNLSISEYGISDGDEIIVDEKKKTNQLKNLSSHESSSDKDSSDDDNNTIPNKTNFSNNLETDNMNKINVFFECGTGFKINLIISRKETISKLLKSFFLKVGLSLSYSKDIFFAFNGLILSPNDNRIIEEVIGKFNFPKIAVIDRINLYGA